MRHFFVPIFAGVLVITDEIIKWIALRTLPLDSSLVDPSFFELAVHKNQGIAFDIPFRLPFILIISILIGFFLLEIAWRNRKTHRDITASAVVIIVGALGNLYDRVAYGFTVDYVILLGRSAINISDLIILIGVAWLLVASRREHEHHLIHPHEPRR